MTYAIGYFIYGINIGRVLIGDTQASPSVVQALNTLYEEEYSSLDSAYSGNGDEPVWIGEEITKISEYDDLQFADLIRIKTLISSAMKPGSKWDNDFQKKFKEMLEDPEVPEVVKEWLKDQKPEAFLTWGSS